MNQLRLDPLSGRWVVVSTGRAERPAAFVTRSTFVQEDTTRPCPFCPGNEEASPPALETYGPTGAWLVRVVPNLYPAFSGDEPFVVTNRGPVFTQATAGGIHEVLILSPEHDASWSMLSGEQTGLVMAALRDRIEEHSQRPNLRYSQAIVNAGREAGASIEHPARSVTSACPSSLASWWRNRPGSPGSPDGASCALPSDAEEDVGYRVVYADERVLVICPFWSGTPYEMLVIPRVPWTSSATTASPSRPGRRGSGAAPGVPWPVYARPRRRRGLQPGVPLSPLPRAPEPYHWHVHVWPRSCHHRWPASSWARGWLINIVNPEQAAEQLAVPLPVANAG